MRFGVTGSWFRVRGFGYGVSGSFSLFMVFGVRDFGLGFTRFGVSRLGFGVIGVVRLGFWVFGVRGFGFRFLRFGFLGCGFRVLGF